MVHTILITQKSWNIFHFWLKEVPLYLKLDPRRKQLFIRQRLGKYDAIRIRSGIG